MSSFYFNLKILYNHDLSWFWVDLYLVLVSYCTFFFFLKFKGNLLIHSLHFYQYIVLDTLSKLIYSLFINEDSLYEKFSNNQSFNHHKQPLKVNLTAFYTPWTLNSSPASLAAVICNFEFWRILVLTAKPHILKLNTFMAKIKAQT